MKIEIIKSIKAAQKKYFVNDDELEVFFKKNSYGNPAYKICYEMMIGSSFTYDELSKNLELTHGAGREIYGKQNRIFFKSELEGMSEEDISKLIDEDKYHNTWVLKEFYRRHYGVEQGANLYFLRGQIKVGNFASLEEAKEYSLQVDGTYKYMSKPHHFWTVEDGKIATS